MSKTGSAATEAVWLLHRFGVVEVKGVAGDGWDSSSRGLQMWWSEVIGSWPQGSTRMVNVAAELKDPRHFGGKGSSGPWSERRVKLENGEVLASEEERWENVLELWVDPEGRNADQWRGRIGHALFGKEGSGMKSLRIASVLRYWQRKCKLRLSRAEERS